MYLNFLSSQMPSSAFSALRDLYGQFKPRLVNSAWAESRAPLLQRLASGLERQAPTLARLLSDEASRPISACRTEVARSVQTLQKTREALARLAQVSAHDFTDALQGAHIATAQRFTYGPLFAIVPYNFPLNLGLHKMAPALALGLPFVCKAPLNNPRLFEALHALFLESGVPDKDFAFLLAPHEDVGRVLDTIPFPILSFTGSRKVGMGLKQKYWDRRVTLELGGTALAIICEDVPKWALENTLRDLAKSAFGQSGQSCISLQHLILEDDVYTDSVALMKDCASRIGEHRDRAASETICAPLINGDAYAKVQGLIDDAHAKGAEIWQAGAADPQTHYVPPTLVLPRKESAAVGLRLFKEEAFGPIVCVHRAQKSGSFEKTLAFAQAVDANIHASVFTYHSQRARQVYESLNARTVLWNEIPSWRADEMPYGGFVAPEADFIRAHGGLVGNEGPAQTLAELTIDRLFVLP